MRKIAILTIVIGVALMALWLLAAIITMVVTNFPQRMPIWLNMPLGVTLIVLVTGAIMLLIAEREYIVIEIKKLY